MRGLMDFTMGERLVMTFLFNIVVVSVYGVKSDCSAKIDTDVEKAISHCFVQYYQHTANVDFYKGLDVETLRSICTSIRLAVQCTHRKCAGLSRDSFIKNLPIDIQNVMDICVYENIFDVYARNQFCFLQTIPSSERCHNNYQAATQQLLENVKAGNPSATEALCLEYGKMVLCIKASVSTQCTSESATLVDLLIRPTIRFSENCHELGRTKTGKTSTSKPTMSNSNSDALNNKELAVQGTSNISSKTSTSLASYMYTLLTIILTWIARPV